LLGVGVEKIREAKFALKDAGHRGGLPENFSWWIEIRRYGSIETRQSDFAVIAHHENRRLRISFASHNS
jgi:hypothetical protein